ncbi:MAG: phage holin family protein [Bacteroidetes bacterium]|nr:MAG: phage holin family protein [Bacteroidota bacterium]REK04781.1 MAG: phage holin family protein [Bacteroidota bacterium]REK36254.1 MAG: phage holin family protein [Bacteroidota bacterium]REK51083.1 MAG: phage holin family protein [Bacteroidota bacterium]
MDQLARIVLGTIAVFICSNIIPGVKLEGWWIALLTSVVIAALNVFVRPVLVILTIPLTIFSFGFFLLIINAIIVMLTAKLVPGFSIDGFGTALLFSLVLALVNLLLSGLRKDRDD